MTPDETRELLAFASAVDPYAPRADRHILAAWSRLLADVPAEAARAAVTAHYRTTTTTITPAHIHQWWRTARQDAATRHTTAELRARRELVPARYGAAIAALAAAKALRTGADADEVRAEMLAARAERRAWLAVHCPHCGASPGSPCRVRIRRGERPLREPHPSRKDTAGITT